MCTPSIPRASADERPDPILTFADDPGTQAQGTRSLTVGGLRPTSFQLGFTGSNSSGLGETAGPGERIGLSNFTQNLLVIRPDETIDKPPSLQIDPGEGLEGRRRIT